MLNVEELKIELQALVKDADESKMAFQNAAEALRLKCVNIEDFINRINDMIDDESNDDQYCELDELKCEAKDCINEVGSEYWAYSWAYGGITRWESSMC